jgi:hypothetical protein
MSDVEIALEELECLQSLFSSMIYRAKSTGDLSALESIIEALNRAIDEVLEKHPEVTQNY